MSEYIEKIDLLRHELSSIAIEKFDNMTPGYQKNFVTYIYSAKTQKTLEKRVKEVEATLVSNYKTVLDYKKSLSNEKIDNNAKNSDINLQINEYFLNTKNRVIAKKLEELYNKILRDNSELSKHYAWNQPMIKMNETFIIGFSISAKHFSFSIEDEALEFFSDEIEKIGYERTKKLVKLKENDEIRYDLFDRMIKYKINEKKNIKSFWK